MKINAIIQARMRSSRLPGKVLLPACGKPMLERLIERLRRCQLLNEIWVATTVNPEDLEIVKLCESLSIPTHRGSEEDVLQRVVDCATDSKTDIIVELTGDNPLVDPDLVDKLVRIYQAGDSDVVTNALKPFTLGMVAQVFSAELLQKVSASTQDPLDREHVTRYIYRNLNQFKIFNLEPKESARLEYRLTLDTQEDYKLIKTIFEELYPVQPGFSAADIYRFLDGNKELACVNNHIEQKKE